MVKNKKALILLMLFLAFFNSPAYPKDKRIRYLPSSQDVETVSKSYSSGSKLVSELGCSACEDKADLVKYCGECVKLQTACPNECLTTTSPKAIRCSPDDNTDGVGNYACTSAPFDVGTCSQTDCDYVDSDTSTNCSSRLKDGSTNCDSPAYLKCSSVSVDSTTSPYGLQRRGCPDEYSDELKPNCSGCNVTNSETGRNRIWNCQASCVSGLSPSFQTCDETSGPPRCDGLGSYYDVTYNWAYTTSCTTTQSCNNQCNPTCTPATPSCSSTSSSCADTTCPATQNCPIPCTPPCWDQLVCPPPLPCPKGPCPPPPPCFTVSVCGSCTDTPCTATATCTTTPYIQSYNYSLNSYFKGCIDACTAYADDYERCQDRVACCRRLICDGDEDDGNCCPAYECTDRAAKSDECYNYTDGDCAMFEQDASNCLKGRTDECFEQIDTNPDMNYDFVARTGEAYNITWQINTEPVNEAKNDEDAKFYTMIKVWDTTFKKVKYNSMLHQKSLNTAFSIYGSTLVPKNTLLPGKKYQVQLHYFMYDHDDTDYEVEIKHMSLIIVRVRE